jgi:hypothetical protein
MRGKRGLDHSLKKENLNGWLRTKTDNYLFRKI